MRSLAVYLRWLVALVMLVPLLLMAAPSPSENQDSRAPAEKLRKALDQNVSVTLSNVKLKEAFDHLHEQTKLNYVFDHVTLRQMGFENDDDDNLVFSINLKNVKVRTVLQTILGQYNLGYAIVNDTVVITSAEMAIYRQLRQPVSLDYDNIPLSTALKQLGKQTATNLLLDPRVSKDALAPVTMQLDEVPLETAVRLMAEMAGLKSARLGNVLFVTTETRADKLRADPELAMPVPGGDNSNGNQPLPAPPRVIAAPAAAPAVPAPAQPAVPAPDPEKK